MEKNFDLNQISEEELLKTRICDLPIKIENTWINDCIQELYRELEEKEIKFKPVCYLADEWLTPDIEPVVGIPFYLAHEALIKLEKKFMLEVEGGTKDWCMKLLRHEAGHAINYAYKFFKRKKWRKTFGSFNKEYGDTYRFRPYSKNFVKHLEDYYAQYHPDEDFSETFATWLTPGLDWHSQYKGWNALEKLNYVDELMNEIRSKDPVITKGRKYWRADRIKSTLKSYYRKKKSFSAEDFPDFHDANLRRIFLVKEEVQGKTIDVKKVIQKYQKDILRAVSIWTGERKYIISELIKKIIQRSKELRLVSQDEETLIVLRVVTYVTALIINYSHTGRLQVKKK